VERNGLLLSFLPALFFLGNRIKSRAFFHRRSAGLFVKRTLLMVKIRLSRGGAPKRPFYHIVVTDSRSARDGRSLERIGFYNPVATGKEVKLQLNAERAQHWISQGAQPSDKVAYLLKQAAKTAA